MVDNLIIVYDSNETDFDTNGLGILADAINPVVVEELNGEYILTLSYPIDGRVYENISLKNIIKTKTSPYSNAQLFRICDISRPFNGIVEIIANHISYDLSGIPITPFSATNTLEAVTCINNNAIIDSNFNIHTSLAKHGSMVITKPMSIRSALGGSESSIINSFGVDIKFDNFDINVVSQRGEDNGVKILYGKNLTDLKQEENCNNVYTGIFPYWYSEDEGRVEVEEKIVYFDEQKRKDKIAIVDLSSEFENKPTKSELLVKAQQYINENDLTSPTVSLTVSFAKLSDSEEYKHLSLLEKVSLGDTVHVEFYKLGVKSKSRCIKTTYDCAKNKYISIDLGDHKQSLSDTILENKKNIENTPYMSDLESAIKAATDMITGGLGGHVIMHNSSGLKHPDEILIMDTDDITTAVNVWRWNKNGLGHSSNGYNGPYELAMLQNGSINANMITSGKINGTIIETNSIRPSNIHSDVYDEIDEKINSVEYVTEYASGDSSSEAPTEGWNSEESPEWMDGRFIWSRTKRRDVYGEYQYGTPVCIQGIKGADGLDGIDGINGQDGVDGSCIEFVFIRTDDDNQVATPITSQTDGYVPVGWSDDYVGVDPAHPYSWMTSRTKANGVWSAFSPPKIFSRWATDGRDGVSTYFHIKYSANEDGNPMSEEPNTYIGTYVDYTEDDSDDCTMYKWTRLEGLNGSNGIDGVNGIDGTTSYLHIAYANSSDGVTGFDTVNSEDKIFIGQYVDDHPDDSQFPNKYKWTKIKGEQGEPGIRGLQGLQGADGTDGINGTNGVDGRDGIDGVDGKDGKDMEYIFKNTSTLNQIATPATSQTDDYVPSGWSDDYVGVTKEVQYSWMSKRTKINGIWSDFSVPKIFSRWSLDGLSSYFHIKYSPNQNGNPMSEIPDRYIGTYVDNKSADSADYTDYNWSLFEGRDGNNGIDGINGTNGVSSYLHIAYANSSDGSVGFDKVNGEGKLYIGQYVDNTLADSDTASRYTWTLIKGRDGIDGTNGSDGSNGDSITGVTNYYLAYGYKTGVTTSFDGWTTAPQNVDLAKPYLWNYEKITYSSGNTTVTKPCVIGNYAKNGADGAAGKNGTNGTDGVDGKDGKGIVSITEYYKVGSSPTTPPTGTYSTTPQATTESDRYLWNYEVITYTSGSPTTTAKRVIGTHGISKMGPWICFDLTSSAFSEEYYYPLVMDLQTGKHCDIELRTSLHSSGRPSWCTHIDGFSLSVKWTACGSGWGAFQDSRTIYEASSSYLKTNVIACGGIGQITEYNKEFIYVRGGGKYFIRGGDGEMVLNSTNVKYVSAYVDYGNAPYVKRLTILPVSTALTVPVGIRDKVNTAIDVLEDKISLKVSTGMVSNQLSVETGGVSISGNRLTVDSNNFKLTSTGTLTCTNGNFAGTINATAGHVGGYQIYAGTMMADNCKVGMSIGDAAFWAGNPRTDCLALNTSKFIVYDSGYLQSTSGSIGGWSINEGWLGSPGAVSGLGTGDIQFWAGAPAGNASLANYRVYNNGDVWGNYANFANFFIASRAVVYQDDNRIIFYNGTKIVHFDVEVRPVPNVVCCTPVPLHANYLFAAGTKPSIYTTPITQYPNTRIKGATPRDRTNIGFNLYMYRTDTDFTTVSCLLIGREW